MINTYKLGGETWLDIDHGTPEEIHSLMDTYKIHPFVAKELTTRTPKPRIDVHKTYIYCILHFPAWKHTHSPDDKNQEIDFIVGKSILITARYDTIDTLHKLAKDFEVDQVLEREEIQIPGHQIFIKILKSLYTGIAEELEAIEDGIDKITSEIFKEKEREMVVSISEITRTLLEFKKVTDLHSEILDALKQKGGEMFGKEFENEMDSVILDYQKISTSIKSNIDMLKELRETDNSLLTAKQNETIKRLTLVGAVLFMISILIALFY